MSINNSVKITVNVQLIRPRSTRAGKDVWKTSIEAKDYRISVE